MSASRPLTHDIVWHRGTVSRAARWRAHRLSGATIWLTGLSGSGKSTVACEIECALVADGRAALVLDGDNLRHGLNRDLGFSAADRTENVRRAGEAARLVAEAGAVAVVSLISPYAADRDAVRCLHAQADLPFLEVWMNAPLAECERRDPKGLYAKARAGALKGFTGIDDPYEPPRHADVALSLGDGTPADQARQVIAALDRATAK